LPFAFYIRASASRRAIKQISERKSPGFILLRAPRRFTGTHKSKSWRGYSPPVQISHKFPESRRLYHFGLPRSKHFAITARARARAIIDIERRSIGYAFGARTLFIKTTIKTTRLELLFVAVRLHSLQLQQQRFALHERAFIRLRIFSSRVFYSTLFRASAREQLRDRDGQARLTCSISILRKHANLSNYRISDANENARINRSDQRLRPTPPPFVCLSSPSFFLIYFFCQRALPLRLWSAT